VVLYDEVARLPLFDRKAQPVAQGYQCSVRPDHVGHERQGPTRRALDPPVGAQEDGLTGMGCGF